MKNKILKNNIKKMKLSNEVILTHSVIKSLSKNQLEALTPSLLFATSIFKILEKKILEDEKAEKSFNYQIIPFNIKELAELEHRVYLDASAFHAIDKIRLLKTMSSSQALNDNAFLSRCKAILNLTNKERGNTHQAKASVYDYIRDNLIDAKKSNESEQNFIENEQASSTKKKELLTQEEADNYVKNLLVQFIQESEKNKENLSNKVLDNYNKPTSRSGFTDDASVFFKKKKKQRATKPANLHTYFPSDFSLEYIKTHPIKYSLANAKIKRVSSNGTPLKIKFSLVSEV